MGWHGPGPRQTRASVESGSRTGWQSIRSRFVEQPRAGDCVVTSLILAWTWPVAFERPAALWLFVPLALMVWTMSRRSLAGLAPMRRRLAIGTRLVVIALLLMALAGAHRTRRSEDLAVIYAIDVSRSIPE